MKKLLMKLFPKYFNVTVINKIPEEKSKGTSFTVRHLSESDSMTEALGISVDRGNQIDRYVINAMRDHDRATSAMEEISANLVHANELYFASYLLHKKIKMMHDPFLQLLTDFTENNDE